MNGIPWWLLHIPHIIIGGFVIEHIVSKYTYRRKS